MQHLIDATRQAVQQKNWYAALSLALTMPDICGRIAYPNLRKASKERVVQWFDHYLAHLYVAGFNNMATMKGGDFYALRCAYLHQGEFELEEQNARKILNRFHLTVPGFGIQHNNLSADGIDEQGNLKNAVLQLQVDMFCEEVCEAVEKWQEDVKSDTRVQSEIEALGKLYSNGAIR
jgi:hypothetical protein